MAYRRDRRSIRETYEEHFPPRDVREVTVQRVVNIVEKRGSVTRPELEYDRGYDEDQWYGGSRTHQDAREYRGEGAYPSNDRGYTDDNPNFGSFRRNSSPPLNEDPYSHYSSNRDDGHLRRQVEIRSRSRGSPYFRSRGRGSAPRKSTPDRGDHKLMPPLPYTDRGEDHDNYRRREPYTSVRDRSPIRREGQPPIPVRTGSNTSSRSYSPDKDKGYTYQQLQQRRYEETCGHNRELDKSSVLTSHTLSDSVDGSPRSSVSSKENPPASVTESEEAVAASTEPKTPEEDFKARRAQAIAAKALEIETLYRQDCETFGRVVKMLAAKEPSLDKMLQTPLTENLLEIKQRCLDDLKHFIKELDQVIQQPEAST
ncbi:periphilin-1-like isoform X1 [Centroberyx affinis]|uniref:periphilin-1-like n=1 Tax=Centroberyx affinis TaxID=166261 RepID=UPI003A5BD0F3